MDIILFLLSVFFIIALIFCYIFLVNRCIKKKSFIKDLLIAIGVASICRWGFFEISTVPTGSMEDTIHPGDFTLVSKLHYGPRTPMTLLQVPLTHQTTHFTKLKSYLEWITLPFLRLRGFSQIKRGDVVVFNTPSDEKRKNIDMKTFYVKRCMGLPGENIEMRENDVFINGENVYEKYKDVLIRYIITSKKILTPYWFKRNNIKHHYSTTEDNVYLIVTTKKNIEKIKKYTEILNIDVYYDNKTTYKTKETGKKIHKLFIANLKNFKNTSNWGPVLIPAKGMELDINEENIKIYGSTIERDSYGEVKCIDNKLFYKDKEMTGKYIFRQDHYFMIGDNLYNSLDSRYWGMVPESHIYAKTERKLFSKDVDSWISGLTFRGCCKAL